MRHASRPTETDTVSGIAVACHGPRVLVRDDCGRDHACTLYGRRLEVVCGDRVRWHQTRAEGAAGVVVAVEPRATSLARIDARGRPEVVAANLPAIVAVIAPAPAG